MQALQQTAPHAAKASEYASVCVRMCVHLCVAEVMTINWKCKLCI